MSRRPANPSSDQTTALSQGGCLSGFLIPPLAVICVGFFLSLLWFGSGSISGQAAVPGEIDADPVPVVTGLSGTLSDSSSTQPGRISPVFQPAIQYWNSSIQVWAGANELDPNLVATVMQIESCGDPRARSRAGAMGLFQVMPYHFTVTDDPFDPDTNAARGMAYLKRSLKTANGNVRLALAGYNGGIGVIGRSESNWAAETRRYVYWGSGIYEEASGGATVSGRLQEWMAASGGGLCRQALSRLGINP
jgi:hypothetical protein